MAVAVIMPKQGQSVESCIITQWYKKKGDQVNAGELLFSYETDKAAFEVEAQTSGILLEIFFQEGEEVPVLANLCVIGNAGESTEPFKSGLFTKDGGNRLDENLHKPALNQQAARQPESGSTDRIKISPRAKQAAEKLGINIRTIRPTGPGQRIIYKDLLDQSRPIDAATSSAALELANLDPSDIPQGTGIGGRITTADLKNISPGSKQGHNGSFPGFTDVPLSLTRKTIARAMCLSLTNAAQLTLHSSFDATRILSLRKKIKDAGSSREDENITLTDMIIFAVSRTLLNHKALNAHFLDDKIRCFTDIHIGVAVDTDRGLLVPVLFNVHTKSLKQISGEMKKISSESRAGSINPDLLHGAGFTVTNLGMYGIESFTPVLNPPQTGILGINTIIQRIKDDAGKPCFYPAMGLSLTFDHRALDGAPAALFLVELKERLENFHNII